MFECTRCENENKCRTKTDFSLKSIPQTLQLNLVSEYFTVKTLCGQAHSLFKKSIFITFIAIKKKIIKMHSGVENYDAILEDPLFSVCHVTINRYLALAGCASGVTRL